MLAPRESLVCPKTIHVLQAECAIRVPQKSHYLILRISNAVLSESISNFSATSSLCARAPSYPATRYPKPFSEELRFASHLLFLFLFSLQIILLGFFGLFLAVITERFKYSSVAAE